MYNCNFVDKKLQHNNSKPTTASGKIKVSKNKPQMKNSSGQGKRS